MNMRSGQRGFSLLELSVVLVIMSLLVSGGVVMLLTSMNQHQYDETTQKIARIEEMLLDYRRAFGRVPCPADITIAQTSAGFGGELPDPGTCTGANFDDAADVVAGIVPTKALQLPDEYALDGWGRRIVYAVDKKFTAENAFATIAIDDTLPANAATIIVQDGAGNIRTNAAVYAIISAGKNGHGAWLRVGGATRMNASSSNAAEQQNCHCNASAVASAFDNIFIQQEEVRDTDDATNSYDDIVTFSTRALLRDLNE